MRWTRKHLLTMRELDASEIVLLVDTAASLQEIATREIKKVPALRGKTIVNLFYEPSTRTRTSFEIAGKWLSADVINFSASGSSTTKGESFIDTAKNIAAMSPDVVIVRHSSAGAAELLARTLPCSIVNAGDGAVIMLLRLQPERMTNGLIPSLREYSRYWGLTLDKLAKHARPDVLIMHPGPVNRGIELAPEVADGPYSVILDQVAKGVAVRMGVLLLLAGSKADAP